MSLQHMPAQVMVVLLAIRANMNDLGGSDCAHALVARPRAQRKSERACFIRPPEVDAALVQIGSFQDPQSRCKSGELRRHTVVNWANAELVGKQRQTMFCR